MRHTTNQIGPHVRQPRRNACKFALQIAQQTLKNENQAIYILYILYEFHTLHIRANELINQLQLPLQLQIVYGKYANNYNQFRVVLTFLTCCRLTISQLLL